MANPTDYDFVQVELKSDVAKRIKEICDDAKRNNIFISKSDLLRIMLNNGTIIEYTIKTFVYNKKVKNSDLAPFASEPKPLNTQ